MIMMMIVVVVVLVVVLVVVVVVMMVMIKMMMMMMMMMTILIFFIFLFLFFVLLAVVFLFLDISLFSSSLSLITSSWSSSPSSSLSSSSSSVASSKSSLLFNQQLSSTALESHLTKLKEGGMTDGATLYAVWSSLLNRWFSDPHTKVFIITAAIDMATLKRLCHLVLNHRVTAALEMLATPLQSRCGRLADIRREVMEQLPPRDRVFAEYKVYSSMVFPATEFQAKFIAGVRGDSVEVLSTSADAETNHFRAEHCSMVQFQTVSLAEFDRRLLGPVLASVEW